MLNSLRIHNFRNFSEKTLFFDSKTILLHGDNGKGKSSILEALLILGNIRSKIQWDIHTRDGETSFFIQIETTSDTMSVSYDLENKKKVFLVNGKKSSSKQFYKLSPIFCHFSPESMNLFVLWPSQRRDTLDNIIGNTYPWYDLVLQHYTKILKTRNKTLQAISEKKAKKQDLDYWDNLFCEAATEVYRYRYILIEYFHQNKDTLKKFVWDKYPDLSFRYISKIDFSDPKSTMWAYLSENRERDIIIGKTQIWPHRDDFDILTKAKSIAKHCSRGETKSILLGFKFLESQFIEEKTQKKTIFLLDDFWSELDAMYKQKLLHLLQEHQTLITNIEKISIPQAQYIHI